MKTISIVIPCYNEEDNVHTVCERTLAVFEKLPGYTCELVFIDNASTDRTVERLKEIASADAKIKIIVNARNFGHIRSPYHALMTVSGDAGIIMAGDLQDPPEVIPEFVKKWEAGFPVVLGVKHQTEERGIYFILRKLYYWMIGKLSELELIPGFHGYGLLDRVVLDKIKTLKDPYPYFRGVICEVGFPRTLVEYQQPLRKKGITKNNFYTLYDMAMLGLVNHSKIPLRLAIFLGFIMAAISFLVGIGYLIYKLIFWKQFTVGMAPMVIGLFLLSSVQLIFLGILGEYLGAIFTQVKDRPLVIEKERVNF